MKTSRVWPGAEITDSSVWSHWFGIFAFYTSTIATAAAGVIVVWCYLWLVRKLWRMRYRGESWWD